MLQPSISSKIAPGTYRRLLAYVWPHRLLMGSSLALLLLITLLELLAPWPMKIIVDNVLGSHPVPRAIQRLIPSSWSASKLLLLVAAAGAGFALKLLVNALRVQGTYLSIMVRQRTLLALQGDLFQHLQRQSFTFHDNRRLGDSMYRVNSDAYCVDLIVSSLAPLLTSCLTLAGMFWIVLSLDWQLALLAVGVTPFLYKSVGVYCDRLTPKVRKVEQMEAESMSIVHETFSNLRAVKAFTREDYQHGRFVQQGHAKMNERVRLTVEQAAFSGAVGVITAAGASVVLGVGAAHVLRGSLTLGELLVVLSYLALIYGPLEYISGAVTYLRQHLVKAERVFEMLDLAPDLKDLPGARPLATVRGRVIFDRVSFGYRQDAPVLEDISLSAQPGEVIGIVGATGAGKTTLVSLIPRFYDVTGGAVLIDGHDVRTIQLKSLREKVSLVFQESVLFSGTLKDNISYGRLEASFEEIVAAAKAANAHEFIMSLPEQYETMVGERGVTLSGGERQRISIARAFLKDAPVLILDEPTSALDARTERLLLAALERLMKGRTTFIIAHRLSTIREADRIVVLENGRVAEAGTHRELLSGAGAYRRLYELQLGSGPPVAAGVPE